MTKISNVININKKSTGATVPSVNVRDNEFLLESYLATKKSPGTKKTYNHELRKFQAWYGNRPLIEATSWELLAYNKYLQEKFDNEKTVQRIYSTLRNFYKWLVQMRAIEYNPTEGAFQELTPQQDVSDKILSTPEMYAILEAAMHDAWDHALIAVLMSTGIRNNEACLLNWNDLRISSAGNYYLHVNRKGGELQDLPIEDELAEILLKFRRKPLDPNDSSPVFGVRYGKEIKRITTEGIRSVVTRIVQKAGINRDVTPHWFRHTFASKLASNNAPLREIQHTMNHKSIRTTEMYMKPMSVSVGKYLGINLNGNKGEN